MIVKCKESDKQTLVSFLSEEKILNTFILADIDNYGFDKEFQSIYMDINIDSKCVFVYLLFYNNLILAGDKSNIDTKFISKFLTQNTTVIMGKDSLIGKVSNSINRKIKYNVNYMYYLSDENKLFPYDDDIKTANIDDVDRLHEFLLSFEEFKVRYSSKQMIIDRIAQNEGTHVFIETDGKITTHANSTAKSEFATMIGGVISSIKTPSSDNESKIISKISRLIIDDSSCPCIFSLDPVEISYLPRLGFSLLGKWSILEIENS